MNELELILTDILHCSRTELYLNSKAKIFNEQELKTLGNILKKRGRIEPVQYVLGHTDFMGLRIKTRKGVLIPRPETEILVEAVLDLNSESQTSKLKVLDIGTGSGCIAIALARFLDRVEVVATDISRQALEIAKENAKLNHVSNKIKFIRSDLFSNKIFDDCIKFDLIVSNPPYVPATEIAALGISVNREPKIALDGGVDGLDFYRIFSQEAGKFLTEQGKLALELGCGQSEQIKQIFARNWSMVKFIKDYQDIDRVCIIKGAGNG